MPTPNHQKTTVYVVEDRKRNIMQQCQDMSDALVWMKRYGRGGYVIRNTDTGRILAKHPSGYAGSAYRFLKDAESENGNKKMHELCRGTVATLDDRVP